MNIYGASGHAKVVIDIIQSIGGTIDNIIDDDPEIKEVLGLPVVNTFSENTSKNNFFLAIGDNLSRKRLAGSLDKKFEQALIHPTSSISFSTSIGEGSVVMALACINNGARIGSHCIINTGSIVEHDCFLEDFVHLSPNSAIAGEVHVGEGTQIGIGAVVVPRIQIGKWATIGAGAVVIEDVPDFAVVVGNPGKIIKYNFNEQR